MWIIGLLANTVCAVYAAHILWVLRRPMGEVVFGGVRLWCRAPGLWLACVVVVGIAIQVTQSGTRDDALAALFAFPLMSNGFAFLACVAYVWVSIYRKVSGA